MHRTLVEDHLAHAERHVAEADSRVAQIRQLVAQLEQRRQDTAEAAAILAQFEELLELHIHDRDRLRRNLADCK